MLMNSMWARCQMLSYLRGTGQKAHGLGFWTDRSAVHEAAAQGRALQLQQLIEGGAAVNHVAIDSITPLHEACIQGQTQCVRLLLEAGAQVDARNIDGSTPLCDACAAGSVECVKLLLEYRATVNPPLFTFSPLHEACMGGNSDCVQLMIDHGAFMEAHDCHYGTPLHVSCAMQHYDCAKVLLKAGTPLSLQQISRVAVRGSLGRRAREVVSKLNLPNRIIRFLSYMPPPDIEIE
uniref:ankyrin repeat and SOCS box protein 13 isoform X3 n=1 Tax=Gasterosteus aculeatus aculeatus TaxID=481459 RepID=UPI001A9921CE|nr:ankyrin repeat and SOCS box protein 13 isoform X3 [Gasterosteus aculeatus aculeatus]